MEPEVGQVWTHLDKYMEGYSILITGIDKIKQIATSKSLLTHYSEGIIALSSIRKHYEFNPNLTAQLQFDTDLEELLGEIDVNITRRSR